MNLLQLVNQFWEWTGYPVNWRDKDIATLPIDPFSFPQLDDMRNICISFINQSLSIAEINAFLMCMAVDSECECILDACKEKANVDFLIQLIPIGIVHPQSDARWQMAELLKMDIPKNKVYLETLLNDPHPYVRKRAYNVMAQKNIL